MVANLVLLSFNDCVTPVVPVGKTGSPVKVGDARFAFRSSAVCCAVLKAKKLKEEREEKRSLTAKIVAKSNYETLTTAHQKTVEDKLMQDKISSKETQCTDS